MCLSRHDTCCHLHPLKYCQLSPFAGRARYLAEGGRLIHRALRAVWPGEDALKSPACSPQLVIIIDIRIPEKSSNLSRPSPTTQLGATPSSSWSAAAPASSSWSPPPPARSCDASPPRTASRWRNYGMLQLISIGCNISFVPLEGGPTEFIFNQGK